MSCSMILVICDQMLAMRREVDYRKYCWKVLRTHIRPRCTGRDWF